MNVISTCHPKHLEVFRYTSKYLPKFVKAESYNIVVPASSFELFNSNIDTSVWTIINEESCKDFSLQYIKEKRPNLRSNWIYQQLLKLHFMYEFAKNGSQNLLIWDADTVPTSPLTFFANNKIYFSKSFEGTHKPYFIVIEKLLNLKKTNNFSFIAQCFPCYKQWIIDFVNFIETKHKKPWYDAILDLAYEDHPSSFSEYETLGTFILENYPYSINFLDVKWCRAGKAYSSLENLDKFIESNLQNNSEKISYLSYECW